ncbi:transposable element Tcb2 transposase [Trichonephila clavipes]|nr:transposable element Tcb2 transposase [Trichonephila clavipes]
MTLHSPTENSLAVLNQKILEDNSQVQNVKLGGHQTCLSINRLWHELCDMLRRLVGTTAPGHHDCSIQEGKTIQPEVRFIAKQNSLMKIGNNDNLVLGSFDESTPCLMIVLINCQTKLRINHLTAVKSVAIWETTRKTPRREDRRIVRQALVDPTVTRSTIRSDVFVAIVLQTISRHLAEANLKSKRPFRALPLTPEHRQLRLQWCQARSMWHVTDWQKVVFFDESQFVSGTNDNHVRVWRCPGERYNAPLTVLRHTARTADQDNARPHTARIAQDFLRHFQTLPWPARSPDLSPVEHVWDQLKRHMPSCHSLHDLELAVQDLWAHLPQDNIRCLINSMPGRVAACIAA